MAEDQSEFEFAKPESADSLLKQYGSHVITVVDNFTHSLAQNSGGDTNCTKAFNGPVRSRFTIKTGYTNPINWCTRTSDLRESNNRLSRSLYELDTSDHFKSESAEKWNYLLEAALPCVAEEHMNMAFDEGVNGATSTRQHYLDSMSSIDLSASERRKNRRHFERMQTNLEKEILSNDGRKVNTDVEKYDSALQTWQTGTRVSASSRVNMRPEDILSFRKEPTTWLIQDMMDVYDDCEEERIRELDNLRNSKEVLTDKEISEIQALKEEGIRMGRMVKIAINLTDARCNARDWGDKYDHLLIDSADDSEELSCSDTDSEATILAPAVSKMHF